MKVTKVDRTRLAIGKIKDDGSSEKIFYRSPNGGSNDKNTAVGDVVNKRVKNANQLYDVFFKGRKRDTNTGDFRASFTNLIKELVKLHGVENAYTYQTQNSKSKKNKSQLRNQALNGQIEALKAESADSYIKTLRKIPCGDELYGYTSSLDVFNNILNSNMKNMRKTLKRGENYTVARKLMIGMALAGRDVEFEGIHYRNLKFRDIVEELDTTGENGGKSRLKVFLDAVNRDYYKTNVVKSINKMNTKVQPRKSDDDGKEIKLPGSSQKRNSLNKNEAINSTLLMYAKSPEDSDKTLLRIKGLVFDYFLPNEDNSEFLNANNLWKMPKRTEQYFDDEFEPDDTSRTEKYGKNVSLSELYNGDGLDGKKISKRINYVNYGKYLSALKKIDAKYGDSALKENKKERNIDLFWINYMKEYVEKHYVVTGINGNDGVLNERKCYATDMMFECWKDIIRFICGKYIDIGKGIYHFTIMPDTGREYSKEIQYGKVKDEYEKGITSFDYEAIKAEDDLKRDISVYMVSAAAAFSRSVIDDNKRQELVKKSQDENPGKKVDEMEDIFFLKDGVRGNIKRTDARKQLLRFYGGQSSFEKLDEIDEDKLIDELLSHLKSIRNENFHFTKGKNVGASFDITEEYLFEKDKEAFKGLVKQRYDANNITMFYNKNDIVKTVEKLYAEEKVVAAQVPAFRKVWKRETLPEYVKTIKKNVDFNTNGITKENEVIYEGTLYFLLKEIYYRDFVVNKNARKHFTDAVKEYVKKRDDELKTAKNSNVAKQLKNAADSFSAYVDKLQKYSFGQICQAIMQEYSQQNSKSDGEEIYQHFKMIFPICVKKAFCKYLNEAYAFIKKPLLQKEKFLLQALGDEEDNNDSVTIGICENKKFDKETGVWYTFAHFLHPRQLNHLVGSFKNYVQYKEDIVRRKQYAGQADGLMQENDEKVENAKKILEILDFVRSVSGRVSNTYEDYYESKDEYADYLAKYIDYKKIDGKTSFESFSKFCSDNYDNEFDIYADKENPKVLRNVEIARMYAGGDVEIGKYKKISKEEIIAYKEKYVKVKVDENDRRMVAERQKVKNRITLNDITDIFSLINDLLGELVSLSYLKERDEMYLLLGFYSMAMKNEEGWGEELKKFEGDDKVGNGLVLYQVCSLFDFGLNLPRSKEKKEGGSLSVKIRKFAGKGVHEQSWEKAMRIFEREEHTRDVVDLRNYVDHMKYYAKQDKSIVSLYSEYYTKMFAYNSKLRKSVLYNFKSILEKYFIVGDIKFDADRNIRLKERLKSTEFTYKSGETGKGGNKKGNAKDGEVKVDARSKDFLENVQEILNYQRKQ